MKLGILNEFQGYHANYIKACEDLGVNYEVIDILSSKWVENLWNSSCDGFLVRPSFQKDMWKRMYDEKLYFIKNTMKKEIYPSYEELFLYENKKCMSYWLDIMKLPHPRTNVFYLKQEAEEFLANAKNYPLVFKPSIGSGALGVKMLDTPKQGLGIAKKIFSKGRFPARGYTKWVKTKYGISYPMLDDKQYHCMLVQEKIDVKYEWRIIRIGQSYFGYQKLKKGQFHSGSNLMGFEDPPKYLLELIKRVCDEANFSSMDLDVFEDLEGQFYINEMQSIFGSYNPSQMYINGKPGRYINSTDGWEFQEGYYNQNGSCNLRVLDFINKLSEKREEIEKIVF